MAITGDLPFTAGTHHSTAVITTHGVIHGMIPGIGPIIQVRSATIGVATGITDGALIVIGTIQVIPGAGDRLMPMDTTPGMDHPGTVAVTHG